MPPAGEHLVDLFWRLDGLRPNGQVVGRIPPTEIESWMRLCGASLSSWELETLIYMDEARVCGPVQLEFRSESKTPVDGGNLSADSFDAMFG